MAVPQDPTTFVPLFTKAQRPLFLFILGLTGSPQAAEEILAGTNLVIWSKADQFEQGTSFFAWACQIARYEVLQHRQRHRRDKLKFSDEFIDTVSEESIARLDDTDLRRQALEQCLQKLPTKDRDLIRERYPVCSRRPYGYSVYRRGIEAEAVPSMNQSGKRASAYSIATWLWQKTPGGQ